MYKIELVDLETKLVLQVEFVEARDPGTAWLKGFRVLYPDAGSFIRVTQCPG